MTFRTTTAFGLLAALAYAVPVAAGPVHSVLTPDTPPTRYGARPRSRITFPT